MTALNYCQMPGLEEVYLEDSYVLGIEENESSVSFLLDLVLTERHPAYSHPNPGEQYCYRKSHLNFENVAQIEWLNKTMNPYTDASGEVDYGNIDVMNFADGVYHLCGDWGEIKITSSCPPGIKLIN